MSGLLGVLGLSAIDGSIDVMTNMEIKGADCPLSMIKGQTKGYPLSE